MGSQRGFFSGWQHGTWQITVVRLIFVAAFIVLGNALVSWVIGRLEIQIWPEHVEAIDRAVLVSVVAYILLMAMPFLPGIEIGVVLMMILGGRGVLLIYVCTLFALTLSFSLGKLVPARALASFLAWLQLNRAAEFLRRFDAIPPERRIDFLVESQSTRVVPALLKRRYLLLAVLLNLPGNALIGGGGGIALMAGMSRLYTFPRYLLVLCFAILPGPLLILLSENFGG
jgi:hypothetical protein